MTFRHPHNHPWSFTMDVLLVHQLLAQDCSPCEHMRDRRRRRVLIPRVYISLLTSFQRSKFLMVILHILQPPDRSGGPILHHGPFHQHRHSISRCTWGFRSLYGYGDLRFGKSWVIGALNHEYTRSPYSIICFQGRDSPVHQEVR